MILAGLASTVVAYALILPIGLNSNYTSAMFPTFFLGGLGFALAYGPLNIAATNGIAPLKSKDSPEASSTPRSNSAGRSSSPCATTVNSAYAGPDGSPRSVLDGFHAAFVVSLIAAAFGVGVTALGLLRRSAPATSAVFEVEELPEADVAEEAA